MDTQEKNEDPYIWIKQGHPTKIFKKKELGGVDIWAYKPKRGNDNSYLIFIPRIIIEELV